MANDPNESGAGSSELIADTGQSQRKIVTVVRKEISMDLGKPPLIHTAGLVRKFGKGKLKKFKFDLPGEADPGKSRIVARSGEAVLLDGSGELTQDMLGTEGGVVFEISSAAEANIWTPYAFDQGSFFNASSSESRSRSEFLEAEHKQRMEYARIEHEQRLRLIEADADLDLARKRDTIAHQQSELNMLRDQLARQEYEFRHRERIMAQEAELLDRRQWVIAEEARLIAMRRQAVTEEFDRRSEILQPLANVPSAAPAGPSRASTADPDVYPEAAVASAPPGPTATARKFRPAWSRHRDAGRFSYMTGLAGAILFMATGAGPVWLGFLVAFLPASLLAAWVTATHA